MICTHNTITSEALADSIADVSSELQNTIIGHTLSEVEQSVNEVSAAHNSVNFQCNEDRVVFLSHVCGKLHSEELICVHDSHN